MQRIATVHIWDQLDEVAVVVSIRKYDGMLPASSSSEYAYTTTFPGSGEPDPREWIRDALVAALEAY